MVESTKAAVLEAMMRQEIPATNKERRLTLESVRQEGRLELISALASQLLTPSQLEDLEAIADPVERERRLVELLRRH